MQQYEPFARTEPVRDQVIREFEQRYRDNLPEPTVMELCELTHRGKADIFHHLQQLAADKILTHSQPGRARAYRLSNQVRLAVADRAFVEWWANAGMDKNQDLPRVQPVLDTIRTIARTTWMASRGL